MYTSLRMRYLQILTIQKHYSGTSQIWFMETGLQGTWGMAATSITKSWTSLRWDMNTCCKCECNISERCMVLKEVTFIFKWMDRIIVERLLLMAPLFLFTQSLKQNGSIYIHIYFTKSGFHPDPKRKGQYRRLSTVHTTRSEFVQFFPCFLHSLTHLCDTCVFAAHTFGCVSRPVITHYQCMGEPTLKPRACFHTFPLQQCSTSTRGGSSSRPRTCWREKQKLIRKWSR